MTPGIMGPALGSLPHMTLTVTNESYLFLNLGNYNEHRVYQRDASRSRTPSRPDPPGFFAGAPISARPGAAPPAAAPPVVQPAPVVPPAPVVLPAPPPVVPPAPVVPPVPLNQVVLEHSDDACSDDASEGEPIPSGDEATSGSEPEPSPSMAESDLVIPLPDGRLS